MSTPNSEDNASASQHSQTWSRTDPSHVATSATGPPQGPVERSDGHFDAWPSNKDIRLPGHSFANSSHWRGSSNRRGGHRGRGGYNTPRGDYNTPRGGFNAGPGRLQPYQNQTQLGPVNTDHWKTWPEVTVRVLDLPNEVQLRDLYTAFHKYGSIISLDVMEKSDGTRQGTGRVRFQPVPLTPFWTTRTHEVVYLKRVLPAPHERGLDADNEKYLETVAKCRLELQPPRASGDGVRSPVSNMVIYPERCTLQPTSMQFGVMLGQSKMMVMKDLPAIDTEDSTPGHKIEADLHKKEIRFFFTVAHDRNGDIFNTLYRFTVRFSNMKVLQRTTAEDGSWALVLSLPFPPRYFWRREDVEATMHKNTTQWYENDRWYRAINIVDKVELIGQVPTAYHVDYDDANHIDIGRWTTFRFTFGPDAQPDPMLAALCDFNIPTVDVASFDLVPRKQPVMWDLLDETHNRVASSTSALDLLASHADTLGQMDFEVRYHLEACVTRHLFSEHLVTAGFLSALASMRPKKAKGHLAFYLDSKAAVADPMEILEDGDASLYFPTLKVPQYCTVIRKATVTPTTVHFGVPTVEMDNRVLRHYQHLHDRFMRVQFVDEANEGRISAAADKEHSDEVFRRVWNTLTHGIRVGGRLYSFLAFGNSQIRECGAYFFCETDHVSCDDIRRWMGSFGHIRNVAKYASRLGQCFSTTRAIRGVHVPAIKPIADVERNGFCFTDGVGKMSKFMADMVVEEMGLHYAATPSAFQFRMGGCKGVLVVWPDTKGMEVHVRKSQEKFKAQYNGLEVIRGAHFSVATLNRQTITILSGLGVPDRVFLDLLHQQLKNYDMAMTDNDRAIELLKLYVDENQHTLVIREMIEDGFLHPDVEEPFVKTLLSLWKIWSLKLLKEKARIIVDKGAFVMGCVDETATLRGYSKATEGTESKRVSDLPQIFLQVPDPDARGEAYRAIVGPCLVGRNPSLHPGDIRVVEAVDVAQLRHLRDVVVFPQTGDRDVPSMLSGGDLDGDDYFVIWDPKLLPPCWHYIPMHGTPAKPKELSRDVEVQDIRDFFVKYMKSDILPQVALAHLGNSDLSPDGIKNEKSLRLAELHSNAVDYVKTGEPVELPRWLIPSQWPHFMEKKRGRVYRSQKILGQIYDKVVSVQFQPTYDNFDQRILGAYTLDDAMLAKAREIKSEYDRSIRRLMAQRDVATEFEFWTGFALSRPTVGSGYKLQEALGQEGSTLKWRFKQIVHEAAGGATFDKVGPFLAAMYQVTAEEVKIALAGQRAERERQGDVEKKDARMMPLISFPWIFHKFLGRIATGGKKVQMPLAAVEVGVDEGVKSKGPSRRVSGEAGGGDGGDDDGKIDADDARVARLNDGRVIHCGEVLDIFHTNLDDEEEIDADSGQRAPAPLQHFMNGPLYEEAESVKSESAKSGSVPGPKSRTGTGSETPLTEVSWEPQLQGQKQQEQKQQEQKQQQIFGWGDKNQDIGGAVHPGDYGKARVGEEFSRVNDAALALEKQQPGDEHAEVQLRSKEENPMDALLNLLG